MKIVKLGQYVKIRTGKLDANANSPNGIYPFFTCAIEPLRIDNYAYDCECVLVAGNGDLNVKHYNGKFNAYQRTYIIECLDNRVLDTKFLYHYLSSYVTSLRKQAIGGVIKYIKLGYLTNADIPLPPIETQKKIAEVLDKAQELIDKRKEQIALLDDFIQSVFIDMFGDPSINPKKWDKVELCAVFEKEPQNGLYKHSSEYTSDNTGVPILRIDSFYNGKLENISGLKRLHCTKEEIEIYKLINDNIVINRVNSIEYLGKCALIRGLNEDTVFESNMMRLTINKSLINPLFLTKLLCSKFIYNQVLRRAKKAVNQASINQKDVSNLNILLPPLDLQNEFAQIVEKTEQQRELLEKSLIEMENNFNSLMQRAFRGELF